MIYSQKNDVDRRAAKLVRHVPCASEVMTMWHFINKSIIIYCYYLQAHMILVRVRCEFSFSQIFAQILCCRLVISLIYIGLVSDM